MTGIYLQDIPLAAAQARLREALQAAGRWGVLGAEEIALDENALGRTLAQAVWARLSSPHYHAAAMDGFALRAAASIGALAGKPLTLRLEEQTAYVDTGDPLPDWADAVVPIELVEPLAADGSPAPDPRKPHAIRLRAALSPWAHVRALGEDIVATELLLPAGQVLRAVDLGAAAAGGQSRLTVSRMPRVHVIPTGSELVPIGAPLRKGEIIEYNTVVLAAQVTGWGGQATRHAIVRDAPDAIATAVQAAADGGADLILLNAGSSAGSEDYAAQVVQALGELLVHGVAVRPGHPVILGMIRRAQAAGGGSVPIIGVPGYPVSAALTGEIFVRPLIEGWLGHAPQHAPTLTATLTRKIVSPAGDDDYARVALGRVDGRLLAAPLSRGAGVISSLVRADGLAILPRGTQGAEAGTAVTVHLLRPAAEVERALFAIGSHDLTLDLLAQFLAERGRRLVSANAGSLGGLIALRRGEAHFAGSHLLDGASGVYNLPAIRDYLPDEAVRVMGWVGRVQGLLVAKGNPLGLREIGDLGRARFVNRQRGAGTRVLLDYWLGQLGLHPDQIDGYANEEYTHLAVAAAVASGRADCGLGIQAAARALDLDFVPLAVEPYDLVIPMCFVESGVLEPLFALALDKRFRKAVQSLEGYEVDRMGEIVADLSPDKPKA